MSASPDVFAAPDDYAQAEATERDGVTIVNKEWTDGSDHPPALELDLSDGRLLSIRWDIRCSCRWLILFEVNRTIAADVALADTGLSYAVLSPLVDDVYNAYREWCQDCDGGADGPDTWAEHRGET